MADTLLDFDGFEKYGPAAHTNIATFGAATATANLMAQHNNQTLMRNQGFFQEWFLMSGSTSSAVGLITGRAGGSSVGIAIADFSANFTTAQRSLPGSYNRIMMGFAIVSSLGGSAGVGFGELIGGGSQCSIFVDTSGRVNFNRGAPNSGLNLYQSSAQFLANAWHYLEVDFTIHNTTGQFSIWIDGVLLTSSAANQNTRGTGSNNFATHFYLAQIGGVGGWDDMYWKENTTGTATRLGDSTIDRLPITANDTVQFTPSATVLGDKYIQQTIATNAPGAGQLALVPVTPAANVTINSVACLPQATSGTAKFKGVIYSDNVGSPGSLLSSGTEVVGTYIARTLTLPLITPQALTGGTQYWIGYITDTSVVLQQSDNTGNIGQKKANTYASDAPAGPLSGMTTGQPTWSFWGNCTAGTNYDVVNRTPSPVVQSIPVARNTSATVGNKDYFTASSLANPPPESVYSVKVSTLAQRSDSGARTMNIKAKSGVTESNGTVSGITPGTSMQWYSSRFDTNPNTNFPWGVGEINTIKIGYEVAS